MKGALEYFTKALRINRDDREAILNIGNILINLEKYEETKRLLFLIFKEKYMG